MAGGGEADGDDRFQPLERLIPKWQRIDQYRAGSVRNGMRIALGVDAIVQDVPAPDARHHFLQGFGHGLRLTHGRLRISREVNDSLYCSRFVAAGRQLLVRLACAG